MLILRQLGVAGAGDLADRLAEPGKVEIGHASPRQQPEPPGQLEPVCGNQSPDPVDTIPNQPPPALADDQLSLTLLALSTVTDTVMVRLAETASFNCSLSLQREKERRGDRAAIADE